MTTTSNRRSPTTLKLAVFDLDGTLKVERDPYIYLHRCLGVMAEAEAITAAGLSGQLSYEAWLRADAMLWRGTPRSVLARLFRENAYVPGAQATVQALQSRGVHVALLSSGLLFHAEVVAAELGIAHIFGNDILFDGDDGDPVVSGEVRALVPVGSKGDVLTRLQTELGVTQAETLAVGDTRGDIPMFARAAVSVAVNPDHPDVAAAADIVLPELDLHPLLPRLREYAPGFWEIRQDLQDENALYNPANPVNPV